MPCADAFDSPEPLGKSFLASMALHGSVVAVLVAGSLIHGSNRPSFGGTEFAGGAVGVNPVSHIPMVARSGAVNPVANDTESLAPKAPPQPKTVQKTKEPEPDAIPIKGRTAPPKKVWTVTGSNDRYRPYTEPKPNQIYNSTGGALVSKSMGLPGSGGVGLVGKGSPLGDRFGAYAALLQQMIAQKWNTQDVDPRLRTAPAVVVDFTILRDGTIKNIRVQTGSGNIALDRSAERALYEVGKVDPLPAGYERNEAAVELSFVLSR